MRDVSHCGGNGQRVYMEVTETNNSQTHFAMCSETSEIFRMHV